jgi:hypothetical protein
MPNTEGTSAWHCRSTTKKTRVFYDSQVRAWCLVRLEFTRGGWRERSAFYSRQDEAVRAGEAWQME